MMTKFLRDPVKLAQRKYHLPFRLLAAATPIALACVVSSLNTILQYSGCLGIIIAFTTPNTERDGWKLVPVEADGAMKMAGSAAPASAARNAATNTLERQFETVADIYRACVAMAPEPKDQGHG